MGPALFHLFNDSLLSRKAEIMIIITIFGSLSLERLGLMAILLLLLIYSKMLWFWILLFPFLAMTSMK